MPDHEVYITDWRDARNVPLYEGNFDLDDYTDYIVDWLQWLGPGSHVMAVCQPSVPVLSAVSFTGSSPAEAPATGSRTVGHDPSLKSSSGFEQIT